MVENKLIGEFSAKVWAEEFVRMVKEKPELATDEGTMIGWFANAIMAGYDKHANRFMANYDPHLDEEDPDKFSEVQIRNKAGSEMDERWCPHKQDICIR